MEYTRWENTLDFWKKTIYNGYPHDATYDISMEYLFGETINGSENAFHVATMSNGGGLFKQDVNGYYWYDSKVNAAYYQKDKFNFE